MLVGRPVAMANKTVKDIAEALSSGREQRQSDTTYMACCPAHSDSSPSLSVTQTSNGKILFKCHAGCSQVAVIDALKAQGLWAGSGKTWKALRTAPEVQRNPIGMVHPRLGAPAIRWEYRNRAKQLVGYVYRFERRNNEGAVVKMEIVPLSWCVAEEDGKTEWRWKGLVEPRPLYNEHLLDERKGVEVLIVEGEKAADAASLIFPDYLVMSWQGGAEAVRRSNWACLKGRDVVLWPDADAPGLKAMSHIAEILVTEGVKLIRQVVLPPELPEGWDLADAVPEEIKLDRRAAVITAREFHPSGEAVIDKMNSELAFTILGDKGVVIWEKWSPVDKRMTFSYVNLTAVKQYYLNVSVLSGKRETPVVDYWMQHPARRSYSSVVFEPRVEVPGAFNLWRGFTHNPDNTGDWSLLEEHLRENVAQGDESLYRWVFGFFAQMVQQPLKKPGTSLAIRGEQGSGKTTIGQHVGALFRDNYVLVDDPRYVLGQFNSHMNHALLLQADEGFFAGDPRHVGRLKGLVTSSTNRIEYKGKESFEINNYLRLMVTSNSHWIMPTGFKERRFAVVDCGDGRLQDRPFFKAMEDQLLSGGYEGLLYELLNFDLSTIDIGVIPKTAALSEQKQESLDPVARFWTERLEDGEIWQGAGWEDWISCEDLYTTFIETAKNWGLSRRPTSTQFRQSLAGLLGGHELHRDRRTTKLRSDGQVTGQARVWCYGLPTLKQCQEAMGLLVGSDTFYGHEESKQDQLNIPDPMDDGDIPF